MTRRRILGLLALFVLTAMALGAAAAGWALYTQSGARWVFSRAQSAVPGPLRAAGLSGSLRRGLALRDFEAEVEGLRITTPQLDIRVGPGFFPLRLQVEQLRSEQLTVEITGAAAQTGGDAGTDSGGPPFPVDFEGVEVRALEIARDGQRQLLLQDLSFAGRLHERLAIRRLAASAGDFDVRLSGELSLGAGLDHRIAGSIQIPQPYATALGLAPGPIQLDAAGNADESALSLRSPQGRWALEGTASNLDRAPSWSASIDGASLELATAPEAPHARLLHLKLRAQGDLATYRIEGQGSLVAPNLPESDWSLAGTGDAAGIDLAHLSVDNEALRANASGRVDWSPALRLDLEWDSDRLDLAHWAPQWPEGLPWAGAGRLVLAGDALSLVGWRLGVPGTGLSVEAALSWDLGAESTVGHLDWQGLAWPPRGGERVWRSSLGFVRWQGAPDDWTAQGVVELQAPEGPAGRLELIGRGHLQGLEAHITHGEVLGGTVQGSLESDWSERLSWNARLQAAGVHLGALFPEWPAILDAEIAAGQAGPDEALELELTKLAGQLRGEPVAGHGALRWSASEWLFRDLSLEAPGLQLTLDGNPRAASGLRFDLRADRPALAAPWFDGALTAGGAFSMAGADAFLDIALDGRDVRVGGFAAGGLTASGSAGPGRPDGRLAVRLDQLRLPGADLARANVTFSPADSGQRIDFATQTGPWLMAGTLEGRLQVPGEGVTPQFDGQLTRFAVDDIERRQLGLVEPAELTASPDQLTLGGACLAFAAGGTACLDGAWRAATDMRLAARFNEVGLDLVQPLLSSGLGFSQTLSGDLRWSRAPGLKPSGGADLSVSPGQVYRVAEPDEPLDSGAGRLSFSLADGQLSEGRLQLPFPELGEVQADFAIRDLALDGGEALTGRARIALHDLSALEVLFPGLEGLSGSLHSELELGGRLGDPQAEGQFALRDIRLDVPLLGLEQVGLALEGTVSGRNRIEATGELVSGSGRATLEMQALDPLRDTMRLDVIARGAGLLLSDLPTLKLVADPDVMALWRRGVWNLGGTLDIPEALLAPSDAASEMIRESPDVVLVSDQAPAPAKAPARDGLPLTGVLRVNLGEDVRFELPDARFRAGGGFVLSWHRKLLPQARGQIDLSGVIEGFGPDLQVARGRVRYANRPLDDPDLDIRGERDVYGNTQIRAAGIRIGGTGRRPSVRAYTYPETTEERAWTLLLTGSDFRYGQGVGAFDIGTYIAPRLYISYGIGLFDEARQITVRYDLRRGFGVQATSSQKDNGVDISYTLER